MPLMAGLISRHKSLYTAGNQQTEPNVCCGYPTLLKVWFEIKELMVLPSRARVVSLLNTGDF